MALNYIPEHYQAFAAALPHHSTLLNHLGGIQSQVSEARTALQEAKEALGSKRGDLVQLWSRSQTVEEMLRILERMYVSIYYYPISLHIYEDSEYLRSVPDILESLISEKRLLQAAVLLIRSLKLINKQDMLDIGALSDLRAYLGSQETVGQAAFVQHTKKSQLLSNLRLCGKFLLTSFMHIYISGHFGAIQDGLYMFRIKRNVCSAPNISHLYWLTTF